MAMIIVLMKIWVMLEFVNGKKTKSIFLNLKFFYFFQFYELAHVANGQLMK